jgi:hypothetical protein
MLKCVETVFTGESSRQSQGLINLFGNEAYVKSIPQSSNKGKSTYVAVQAVCVNTDENSKMHEVRSNGNCKKRSIFYVFFADPS